MLGVTRTARGTTARQLLVGTPAGQVYMLDRRLVDPRRPLVAPGAKPTAEQAGEGLPPYQAELPLQPTAFATADRTVKRLRGLVTAPAVLESTVLLVAHGLDLFHTRLTPSRTFDMVPDDFPAALLVVMVVAMAGGALALRAATRRASLKLKWA